MDSSTSKSRRCVNIDVSGNVLKTMKSLCLVIVVSGFLTSCCVFSSQDCGCKPSKPFIAESTKEWIIPFVSENQLFTTKSSSSDEQRGNRVYQEGTECIGGDECCTNYPTHTTTFFFGAFQDKKTLLYTKAIQNEVDFSSEQDGFPSDTFITSFDVTTGKFSKSAAVNLFETDTVINGSKHLKVIFQKIDPTKNKILFTRLEFVKGWALQVILMHQDKSGKKNNTWKILTDNRKNTTVSGKC